jgi:hypothetical protein
VDYFRRTGKDRTPPDSVKDFIRSSEKVPNICELLPVCKLPA